MHECAGSRVLEGCFSTWSKASLLVVRLTYSQSAPSLIFVALSKAELFMENRELALYPEYRPYRQYSPACKFMRM